MNNHTREKRISDLLEEFASALETAGTLAREIAGEVVKDAPITLELKVDGESVAKAACKAMRDNPRASALSPSDSKKTLPSQSASHHQDWSDQS